MPVLLSSLLNTAAWSVDRAVVRAAAWNTQRSSPRVRRLSYDERMSALATITATSGRERYLSDPASFFVPPQPIQARCARVRDLEDGGGVFDARWPSPHLPVFDELRETYPAHANNRVGHARLFLAARPRPAILAIHGYLGGAYGFEERAFPVRWMVRRGFDVALVVLPFHGPRARTDRPGAAPLFPGADPRFTVEGCRHAVHDIRGLIQFLRARGAPSVGLTGMSLGGYVTSLMATLDPDLSFAAPLIPLASFADFARDQGRFGKGREGDDVYRAYDRSMHVVSPFARPSQLAPERVLVLAAEQDQVTPKAHAERLARHFGAPLVLFPGGHLLQFGRAKAFRELGRLWERLSLAPKAQGLGLSRRSHRLA